MTSFVFLFLRQGVLSNLAVLQPTVEQASVKFIDQPASASRMLRLRAFTYLVYMF